MITKELIVVFIAKDNILLTEQLGPECPDRFRHF